MTTERIENAARKGDWCVEHRRERHAFREGRDIGTGMYWNSEGITYDYVDSWAVVRVARTRRDGTIVKLDVPGAIPWNFYNVLTLSPQYQAAAATLVGQSFASTEELKAAIGGAAGD